MKNAVLELADGRQIQYRVRLSPGSRNIRLRVDPITGLVVMVPHGVDLSRVEEIVGSRRDWIDHQLQRMGMTSAKAASALPQVLDLQATGEVWQIEYRKVCARKTGVVIDAPGQLLVMGQVEDVADCLAAMHRWLASRGREILVPWLERLSSETELKYYGVTIRGQLTRLGSCTESNSINLNYKLLFLPQEWVNYILIHELCHTVEKNHTERFWTLVQRFEPKAKEFAAAIRRSREYLPEWVLYPVLS